MVHAINIHDLALPGRDVASRPVSLQVQLGEAIGIVGRAGMGKSLLLRILSGQRPGHGQVVEVLGLDVRREPRRAWESVGYWSSAAEALLGWRSAAENLQLQATQKGLPGVRIDAAVRRQLARHGLLRLATTKTAQLDRDARCRLELAAAVVTQPRLLLLDEPWRGAEADTVARLVGALEQWRAEDPSHTLVVAGESLDVFQGVLSAVWRLDERGLVPCALVPSSPAAG